MEITDIKIRRIITEGRLRAVVSITLDNMLAVHDIKIVQGDERLFVAMPSRKDENGVFRDIVHPISAAARKKLEAEIMETYQQHLALMEAETEASLRAKLWKMRLNTASPMMTAARPMTIAPRPMPTSAKP